MKLEHYIEINHGGNRSEFARRANMHPMNVSRYLRGRIPDRDNLEKIRIATNGQVAYSDFCPEKVAS
ncbi:helix-turn-helix domain-containing protein [Seleniivibrio woodruffii]|uniref:helix-turn-helix domain-containing protein n=1 Tax=Seleniivibrio woodruffii TaxID=1078050 RepID=UPI0024094CFE|nr:helix-turn-helix transcriptional regulator [Seleniivibrio woodruffii]